MNPYNRFENRIPNTPPKEDGFIDLAPKRVPSAAFRGSMGMGTASRLQALEERWKGPVIEPPRLFDKAEESGVRRRPSFEMGEGDALKSDFDRLIDDIDGARHESTSSFSDVSQEEIDRNLDRVFAELEREMPPTARRHPSPWERGNESLGAHEKDTWKQLLDELDEAPPTRRRPPYAA